MLASTLAYLLQSLPAVPQAPLLATLPSTVSHHGGMERVMLC